MTILTDSPLAVINEIARLIRTSVRDSDFVARYGGEEFAAVLPHASREGVLVLAERARQKG